MCDSSTRPAFIPVENTAKVTLRYLMNDQQVMNVFHFSGGDAWRGEDLASLANDVAGAWITNFQPIIPNSIKLEEIECLDIGSFASFVAIKPMNEFGDSENAALPGNVTLSIKFSGGLSGRSHRGRMYWIQLDEPSVVGDTVQATPLAAILAAVEGFFTDIDFVTNNAQHVVVSYCQGGEWLTDGVTTLVNAYTSDGIVDSQRRRLTGRGR